MSLRPLASLVVKMLGLYAVVNALPTISGVVAPFVISRLAPTPIVGLSPLSTSLVAALGGALQMLFGIGLWAFSDGIAHSAVPRDGDLPVRLHEGLQKIGFSVVGVYLLGDAITDFARFATNRYWLNQNGMGMNGFVDTYVNLHVGPGDILAIVIQGAIGAYLLMGAPGVLGSAAVLRNVGRDKEYRNEAPEV